MDESGRQSVELFYRINDTPPWYLCIILGFQHFLIMFGATVTIPLIVTPALCVGDDFVAKAEIIGTIFFVSGMVTIIQATIGIRLPLIQGGTFSVLVPTFAILSLQKWKCPTLDDPSDQVNSTFLQNSSFLSTVFPMTTETLDLKAERTEIWQQRMREIQGAIAVASLFQIAIGLSGIIGMILNFIGPLSIAPTITLIGLSLFQAAANYCEKQWGIAILTMVLILIFSQYMRNVKLPLFGYSRDKGCYKTLFPIFSVFPILLAIIIAWVFSAILTETNVFPSSPNAMTYAARTDNRISVLTEAKWFRFPYPGQWGLPTVSVAGVFGMLAGILAGILESIGDYYAAARMSGAPPPPIHAINRGITIEGIGCLLAGLWGSGSATTTYSENISAIGITRVGSRRVIQTGALIMLFFGIFGKFGALFVTIPDPIVGGVLMIMFGMITAVGISNLQFVDLNSSRNLMVFGFSTLFGLSLPNWISTHSGIISTGSEIADQLITVLLSTSMFVGGTIALILDNTMPGTLEERGMLQWKIQTSDDSGEADTSCYDIPFISNWMRKHECFSFIPICPSFRNPCRRCNQNEDAESYKMENIEALQNGKHNLNEFYDLKGNDGITQKEGHDNPGLQTYL